MAAAADIFFNICAPIPAAPHLPKACAALPVDKKPNAAARR
jgi:hypothetical protein